MRRPYASEQLSVDLTVFEHDVGVAVGRYREFSLPDLRAEFGPRHAVVMKETDAAVAEVVRRQFGTPASRLARPTAIQVVGAPARERGRFRASVLASRKPTEDDAEEVLGQLDPTGPPGLGDLGADEPCLAALVQIADTGTLDLANAGSGRVEHEQADQGARR